MSKTIYRKIWEESHGPIPKGYEIHHINGNHSDNRLENLQLVTPKEHYDIHLQQEDYFACFLIASQRMSSTSEERSELIRKAQNKLVSKGKHHWQTEESRELSKKRQIDAHNKLGDNHPAIVAQNKLVSEGRHLWQSSEFRKAASERQKDKFTSGDHNFVGLNKKRVAKGTHNFLSENRSESMKSTEFARGQVNVVDPYGKKMRISKDKYHSQTDTYYVHSSSKEGLRRKGRLDD